MEGGGAGRMLLGAGEELRGWMGAETAGCAGREMRMGEIGRRWS